MFVGLFLFICRFDSEGAFLWRMGGGVCPMLGVVRSHGRVGIKTT